MSIRVADYIATFLAGKGVRHVFLVTGGGAMHLNDAFGRCEGLQYVACHHEQTCAMAAESYQRMTGRVAAVNVTTGPGGTNALTGVYGAYVDSQAMFVVSGQVKFETTIASTPVPLRQLGDQEIDIISCVRPVTKYAEVVTDPKSIRFHLEKAWHLATTGRPGPVWLDIPMNVQGAQIDPATLSPWKPLAEPEGPRPLTGGPLRERCEALLALLAKAERPVVMAGGGVRASGRHDDFLAFVEALGVPVVTGWNAHDVLWDDHPLYAGRPGIIGDRPGNFTVQNSDLLIVLGSRVNLRQVSYNWKAFARAAYKVMVDVDEGELRKPTLSIDLPIHASLQSFFDEMRTLPKPAVRPAWREWLEWCQERRRRYPVVLAEYRTAEGKVNPYVFVEELFRQLPEGQKIVTGDGTACVVTFQAAHLKKGQRLYTNSGCAAMGYDVPAAIGAAVGLAGEPVVCIAGDGSIMMNLQDLQTIKTLGLPVRLFVLNNEGYHSIRQTQQAYFPDNVVGCGLESGLGFPDWAKVADTFGFGHRRVERNSGLAGTIGDVLRHAPPILCEVVLDLKQQFAPKLASRRLEDGTMVSPPLEDMAPFLDRAELASNLLIPPWKD
jgi:acetolactate synthase-1/2/3 large subunit